MPAPRRFLTSWTPSDIRSATSPREKEPRHAAHGYPLTQAAGVCAAVAGAIFIGYLVLATGYLLIMSTTFVTAYVLPSIAETDPTYVKDVIAVATGGTATGDIGALETINQVQGFAYLAGGLLFGIALYRAHVLARWAAVLLAVGGVVSAALSVMPDAFYRLLAYPNGIAMIGLGYSLWSTARRDVSTQPAEVSDRRATTTGGEATA